MSNLCLSTAARLKNVGTESTSQALVKCGQTWRVTANSVRLLAMMILGLVASSILCANGQKEPDAKRKQQIVEALCSHGHDVRNWTDAKAAMKQIAADNGWQTNRVPDARVLILLDLGNAHSNPWVATQRGGRLDPPYGDSDDKKD